MSKTILILNGPNLNMLGTREPEIYGQTSLKDIEHMLEQEAKSLTLLIECKQSNHEGELIEWIQNTRGKAGGILINAGALTHTSIGIRDALIATNLPVIEVHLSNIFKRESFRHHSFISDIALGVVCGFGAESYRLALHAIASHMRAPSL